jgi:putative tricarboxylic transport membrane protein
VALALVVDVALVDWIGFVVASALMFAIAARAFGSRRLTRDSIVGLGIAAVIYVAFTRGLGVALPHGVFG